MDHAIDQWGRGADLVRRCAEVLLLGVLDEEFGLAVVPPAAPGPARAGVGG